jgi:predicted signal transduction protein with EAL and GGDEF domain
VAVGCTSGGQCSPVQFRSKSLVPSVMSASATSGLRSDRFELEITEAVLLHNDDVTMAVPKCEAWASGYRWMTSGLVIRY